MYYYPQPPVLVPLLGLFIAISCGSAFNRLLELKMQTWYKNPEQNDSFQLKSSGLAATYLAICLGVWIFLGGGFLSFGFGFIPSYGVALPITILTASFLWSQLQDVLLQIQAGGSKALDLE